MGQPTARKPTVGTLQTFTSATLTSPPGPGTPYAYNLQYAGPDGLIPPQHYVATRASLATVDERYYQDVRTTGAGSTLAVSRPSWKACSWRPACP